MRDVRNAVLLEYVILVPPSYVHVYYRLVLCGILYCSVSQPPGRGPVPGPGINYTGPQEILLELVNNLNVLWINLPT